MFDVSSLGRTSRSESLGRTSRTESRYVSHVVSRPYFTYWVTFVQLTCFFFMTAVYGIADIGFQQTNVTGQVSCVTTFLGI